MIEQLLIFAAILSVALVLFARERIPSEVTALGVLLALVFSGLLPAERAFAGFGSDTVMTILGLLILTAALQRTGGKRGIAALCIGGGEATAMAVELVD